MTVDAFPGGVGAVAPEEEALIEKTAIKKRLVSAIHDIIRDRGLTQGRAALLMGVSQPRVSDAVCGKVEKFTIDALVEMLARAGCRVEVMPLHAGPGSN
jgi:predicted XRE-type DNA-binding protein